MKKIIQFIPEEYRLLVRFILFICICIFVVAFSIFVLPWLLIAVIPIGDNTEYVPEITYGEFPFKLVYEIEGKEFTIEDTLICKYNGYGKNEGTGKYIRWKTEFASGNKRIVLFEMSGLELSISKRLDYNAEKASQYTTHVHYDVGAPEYYMGSATNKIEQLGSFPNARLFIEKKGKGSDLHITAQNLLDKYNIELISWDHAEPIENTFSAE